MLELKNVLAARVFFGKREPRAVVEYVAILQNFDKCRAFVRGRVFQGIFQVRLEDVHGARHKRSLGTNGQRNGIERAVRRAVGSRLGHFVELGSRRVLPFGQAVNPVVEEQHFDADIAAQHVNGVVAADGQCVAVTRGHPNFEFRVSNFDSGSNGGRAPVDGVEAVGVHVIGEAAGAANSRNYHKVLPANAQFREHRLHGR